jgi:thioredoxin 1
MAKKVIHSPVTMAATPEGYALLRGSEFHDRVIASGDAVVIEFWAGWCGPCKAMAPYIAKLAGEHADLVRFYRVDVDAETELPKKLGIHGIPTLLFFSKGYERGRIVGYISESIMAKEISKIRS